MKTRPIAALALVPAAPAVARDKILNASCGIARELFAAVNPAFVAKWAAETGGNVAIDQSHGGSSKQARVILQGLPADMVTFNQVTDIDVLAESGPVGADWRAAFLSDASPIARCAPSSCGRAIRRASRTGTT